MCGFIAYKGDEDLGDMLLSHMSYRGLPGFEAVYYDKPYVFAHIALPFVNLDPAVAVQPVFTSGVPGLFVGEVFNYDTQYPTDGQYVHQMYRMGGHRVFHDFDGFWTYVTLANGKLIGYTDYLGQKPLYYRTDLEAMASEIEVLKLLGPSTIDEVFMSNTMKWGYSPDGRTPYNEIKQVPPGHYVYDGSVHKYWNWNAVHTGTSLYNDLKRATELRLGGQREVSILLSGGLDSSIIYGLLKEIGRVPTAIHVDNGEEDYARLVSSDLVDVSLSSVNDFEAVLVHQSPVDLGSVKPQIAMAKKLRQLGFYAVLTGDGADELFGGYRRAKEYDSQQSDVFCELPYYHLPKIDRTMMRYTIETRSPFLAPYIVKRALFTSYRDRIDKKILKEEFASIVPREILTREKHPLKTETIRTDPMVQRKINDEIFRSMA